MDRAAGFIVSGDHRSAQALTVQLGNGGFGIGLGVSAMAMMPVRRPSRATTTRVRPWAS